MTLEYHCVTTSAPTSLPFPLTWQISFDCRVIFRRQNIYFRGLHDGGNSTWHNKEGLHLELGRRAQSRITGNFGFINSKSVIVLWQRVHWSLIWLVDVLKIAFWYSHTKAEIYYCSKMQKWNYTSVFVYNAISTI